MSKTIMRGVASRIWQLWAVGALVGFLGWSVLVTDVLRECYYPKETQVQAGASNQGLAGTRANTGTEWRELVIALLAEDRSGASAICVALLLLALAKFGYLRWRLTLHRQLVSDQNPHARAQACLKDGDSVVRFLSTAQKAADLDWLERRLAPTYDLHGYVGPCITLGLLGTLVGLWIGFRDTLGPAAVLAGDGASLQTALSGSVVVVATAALSSITGIGLGQWVIESLADGIDHRVEELINELRERSLSKARA